MSMLLLLALLQEPAPASELPSATTPPQAPAESPRVGEALTLADETPPDIPVGEAAPGNPGPAPSPWRAGLLASAVACGTFALLAVGVGGLLSCSNTLYCPMALGTSVLAAWLSWTAASKLTRWRAPLLGTMLVSLLPTVTGCGLAVGAGVVPLVAAAQQFVEFEADGNVHISNDTVRAGQRSPITWAWLLGGTAVVVGLALAGYLASSVGVGVWTALQGQPIPTGTP